MGKRKSRKKRSRSRARSRRQQQGMGAGTWVLIGLGVIAIAGFIFAALRYGGSSTAAFYPPTDVRGHTETVPPSHILDQPMPLSMHKHMLEHADGKGPPGVIINYNCEDYECEPDLIDRLRAIAEDYPTFVYLAPFPGMTAKIAVTRRGAQEILDEFDEERIRNFIERG